LFLNLTNLNEFTLVSGLMKITFLGPVEVDDSVLEDHVGDVAVGHFRQLPLRSHQLLRRQRDRIRTSLLKGKSGVS
jgi:hypothetical protein